MRPLAWACCSHDANGKFATDEIRVVSGSRVERERAEREQDRIKTERSGDDTRRDRALCSAIDCRRQCFADADSAARNR